MMKKEAVKGMYKENGVFYRHRKRFLLFPKTIKNEKRWWEFAKWKELWHGNPFDGGAYARWIAIEWLN